MLALLGAVLTFCIALPKSATAHEAAFRGLVLATVPAKGELIVRHGALFGAPAAIQTFRVSGRDLGRLRAGETIEATADADSTPWTVSEIRVLGKESITGAPADVDSGGSQILRDVHHVVVGEYAPTPELVDERGRAFSLRDLRGQAVVMAFVYTRCRDARECPLITARFRALQDLFAGKPVHLVEITLDPLFDRPAVLARYGRTFGQDPARWTLATGDPDTVLDFAAQFEVTAFPDHRVGLIHPEKTVILDRYGAIRELIDEGAWTPGEIQAAVQHDERLASNPFERLDLWLSSAAVSMCGNAVAGFSGFTDLLTVIAIAAFFTFLLWRVGRSIAKGAT
jgi:protein SCO1/2